MKNRYSVVAARASDVPRLPMIELAAATLLAGQAPAAVLAETTSLAQLELARRHGRLWVALCEGQPVGFAHVELIEPGVAHLQEIDVMPAHGRRGLGRALVTAVCGWAAAHKYRAVTLTTFRDVPWNMPFYARLGFVEVLPHELTPALRSLLDKEAQAGLAPERRVAMQQRVGVSSAS